MTLTDWARGTKQRRTFLIKAKMEPNDNDGLNQGFVAEETFLIKAKMEPSDTDWIIQGCEAEENFSD